MILKKPNNSEPPAEAQTQEKTIMTQSPIKRVFAIGATTLAIVGFALLMIKMGKIMAKDLGEMGV